MNTEQGLSALLLGDDGIQPQLYEIDRDPCVLSEFVDLLTSERAAQLRNARNVKLRPVSALFGDNEAARDVVVGATGHRFSSSVSRLTGGGGVPRALMHVLLSSSSQNDDHFKPLEVLKGLQPGGDYSSFEHRFATIRTNTAARYLRGPKTTSMINAIRDVPRVLETDSGHEKLSGELNIHYKRTTSKNNRLALGLALNVLERAPSYYSAQQLVELRNYNPWTLQKQLIRDVNTSAYIIRQINLEAEQG